MLLAGSIAVLSAASKAFAAPPGNDGFQDVIGVYAVPYSTTQSTLEATLQLPDEPLCGDIGATVWYAVTAPANGTLKVSTVGSDFDTVLAAHSGSTLSALQSLDCNDDTGSATTSAVQFDVVSGATYYIQAGGFQSQDGQLALSIVYGTASSNDDFGSAEVVPQALPYTDPRNTVVATTEPPNEPEVVCSPSVPIGRTIWYSYTPSATRLVSATTAGSNFDTVIAVYTGDTLTSLTELACDDDTDFDATSAVQFVASAGIPYRIQAGGYLGDSGDVVFNLSVDTSDTDGDGFTDENETLHIGTSANDPCGNDGWPAELVGNDNRLNIGDFTSFIFPTRPDGSFHKFGHPVPDPQDASIARWNLDPSGSINIADLNALNPAVLAPTARPPMFGGQPAFFANVGNGIGGCPWPP